MADRQRPDPAKCLGPQAYRSWRGSELGRITETLEQGLILSLIGDPKNADLLDVGCGDGALAVALAERGASVVGLDASAAMIEASRDRASRHDSALSLCIGRAEELPFAEESFDLIVAVTILCFVAEAERTFQEMGRVLRPGGKLVIGELGKWSTWAAARRIRGWFGSSLWRQGYFRTPAELQRLARIGGLQPGAVRGAVYYPRSTLAARYLSPLDARLSRITPMGAAFLALSATKPPSPAGSATPAATGLHDSEPIS